MSSSITGVTDSYLTQLTASEKKNPVTQPAQPTSPAPEPDSISLSADGMAALKALGSGENK
jgi:hypothetical protein